MHRVFEGSPELSNLLRTLYRAFGEGPIPEEDLRAHIGAVLRQEALRGPRFAELGVSSLMRVRIVTLVGDHAFRLTPRSAAFAKASLEEDERELALIADDVDVLFRDLEAPPLESPGAAPSDRVDCVTSAFLAEALAEAEIPQELFDTILATYQTNGRVVMSEDGGVYRFVLANA